MKRILVLVCIVLGGCLTAGKRGGDATPAVYDLGLPAPRPAAAGNPPLAVEVRAPYWFDSLGIEYRLAYADPARLHDYSQVRWAGPPAGLIQQRLVQQLGFIPHGQAGARCLVRVEIDEFSQVFASPELSRGTLQVRLAVLDRGRQKVAERVLRIEKPAPTPDSRGGVAALTATVDQLVDELAAWQGELAGPGKLKGCAR